MLGVIGEHSGMIKSRKMSKAEHEENLKAFADHLHYNHCDGACKGGCEGFSSNDPKWYKLAKELERIALEGNIHIETVVELWDILKREENISENIITKIRRII